MTTDLSRYLERFGQCRMLCIGDVMLDHFVYGQAERISPEAPIPVLRIHNETEMLGGAGNVVRNIAALGAKASFIACVGDDTTAHRLTGLLSEMESVESYLQTEKGRISTLKIRYIAGNQQCLRADRETSEPIKETTEKKIFSLLPDLVKQADVIVLSDYAKGMLTPGLVESVIKEAKALGRWVIIDPKRKDFSLYEGASLITPNASELAASSGLPVETEDQVEKAARLLMEKHAFEHMLVTRHRHGMSLITKNEVVHFSAEAKEVSDVSGAGDTVVATLAVSLAAGAPLEEAVFLANLAAGIAVGRLGTAAVYRTDMKTALMTRNLVSDIHKITPLANAIETVKQWRLSGERIGFTNGCFDLLHPGHVSLLNQAKAECNRLVVGLNSDDSVRRLKGETRPVQDEMARALVLASLRAVDLVVIFSEDTPMNLLQALKPDVLVKGADYTIDKVVGADLVKSYGGKIVLATLSEGQSTTRLVQKIKPNSV